MDPSLPDGEPITTTARVSLLIVMAAARQGIDRSELLRAAELDHEALVGEEARIPTRVERRLWQEAAERTGDPLLGLHVLQGAPPGFLGPYELLCTSANTYREAVVLGDRYAGLLQDRASLMLEEGGDQAKLVQVFSKADPSPYASQYYLSALIPMAIACTGRLPRIERVAFPFSRPKTNEQVSALVRHFGTEVLEFNAQESSIVLGREALAWSLPCAAPRLNRILREHADLILARPSGQSTFLLGVRRHLLSALENGTATLANLAERLILAPRTLQRRFAAEGTSFAEVLEALRRELVSIYLEDETMSLAEISFRLGYSSPQAFHRAFRAWVGKSPGRWRRDHTQDK